MNLLIDLLICSIPAMIFFIPITVGSLLIAVVYRIIFGIPVKETLEVLGW